MNHMNIIIYDSFYHFKFAFFLFFFFTVIHLFAIIVLMKRVKRCSNVFKKKIYKQLSKPNKKENKHVNCHTNTRMCVYVSQCIKSIYNLFPCILRMTQ